MVHQNGTVPTMDLNSPQSLYKLAHRRVGIKPIRIYPGSTWENGYNELFNGNLGGKFKRPTGSP
jgi:transposase InsO family protein